MALSPQLQLKQGQSLVMTPQLQQAIKLLQLSNIELMAFVEEQLERNPLLERGSKDEDRRDYEKDRSGSAHNDSSPSDGLDMSDARTSSAAVADLDADASTVYSDDSASDLQGAVDVGGSVDWSRGISSGGSFSGGEDYDAAANTAVEETLQDVLTRQLAMALRDQTDKLIGTYLIDMVDENGYLRTDLKDVAERLGVTEMRVKSVLTCLQTFEPAGVFARDLKECLALQLKDRGEYDDCMQALVENLEMLAKHQLAKLADICNCSPEQLSERITRLKKLSPKPGLAYGSDAAAPVEPDVFVRSRPDGGWAVELNSDTLPKVLVNSRYYTEILESTKDDTAREFMSECHQNASWLVKSLDQRARTILKVSSEIVRQQDGFFAYGIEHIRPLNLKTVAEAIEMHESTVSRVTSNKYMATPRGLFELKFFFTTAIPATGDGEAHSAEAVRHKIKRLIDEETVKNVLSDDKIVEFLKQEGVDIARRTVAKYRESLHIPSSVERRRILKSQA